MVFGYIGGISMVRLDRYDLEKSTGDMAFNGDQGNDLRATIARVGIISTCLYLYR
jgi:hypothetical protein